MRRRRSIPRKTFARKQGRRTYGIVQEKLGFYRAYEMPPFHRKYGMKYERIVFLTASMRIAVDGARQLTGAKRSQVDFN